MYIICGLGNLGARYENTRHNVGFMTIDKLAKDLKIKVNRIKFKSLTEMTHIAGEKVLLMKPTTFMNLSGDALIEAINFYKVPLQNVIVIYDDVDIPFSELRIRKKGSAGTHNGMKSIISRTNSQDFPRLRIGIGKHQFMDLADYVLSQFSKSEREEIDKTIEIAAKACIDIIKNGTDYAMNKYN
ncbi:MAG: aminoacyl-tRNA hydrolase [Tissierellia bacterium]|nr:aminoacyl-tRNA hydrolase [Tissierellia bacterium]